MLHPDNEILFNTKKKCAIKPWKVREKLRCPLLSERSQSEYDSNPVAFWKRQHYGNSIMTSACQGSEGREEWTSREQEFLGWWNYAVGLYGGSLSLSSLSFSLLPHPASLSLHPSHSLSQFCGFWQIVILILYMVYEVYTYFPPNP